MLNFYSPAKAEISRADDCPWKNSANDDQLLQKVICLEISAVQVMKRRFLGHLFYRNINKLVRLERQIFRGHNREHRIGSSFQGI